MKKRQGGYPGAYILEVMGDRIFDNHDLKVKLTDDIDDGVADYQLVEVRVSKKDEKELISAFSDFSNKMLLTGHVDYDEYCEGIVPFFEEDEEIVRKERFGRLL